MKKLTSLFGEKNLSWKFIIIFSVLVGIIVGVMNRVPFLENTSFSDFAVVLELWIILAIFIITNARSRKEAILKTFIFFLISQPLIYFTEAAYESIFSGVNLFERTWFYLDLYYFHGSRWFVWTLLTIPGSAIAYEIKRDNILGSIVLSVATGFLALSGGSTLLNCIARTFPNHLIHSLMALFFAYFFIFAILKKKTPRIISLVLTSLALIAGVAYYFYETSIRVPYCFELEGYDPDSTMVVENCIEE